MVPESAIGDGGRVIGDAYVEIGPDDADYERLARQALTEEEARSAAACAGRRKTRRCTASSWRTARSVRIHGRTPARTMITIRPERAPG